MRTRKHLRSLALTTLGVVAGTLLIITFVAVDRYRSSGEIMATAVERVLGNEWIPVVPPKSELRLGIPATIAERQVIPMCEDVFANLEPNSTVLEDVNLRLAVDSESQLEALIAKGMAKWLTDAGMTGELKRASTIAVTVRAIENRSLSILQLRESEKRWSEDCIATVKEEWQTLKEEPFTVMAVSYWSDTTIQAFGRDGSRLSLHASSQHAQAAGKLEATLISEDQYSVRIPGLRAIALLPWPLRKRVVGLAPDSFRIESDAEPFTTDELQSLYQRLGNNSS